MIYEGKSYQTTRGRLSWAVKCLALAGGGGGAGTFVDCSVYIVYRVSHDNILPWKLGTKRLTYSKDTMKENQSVRPKKRYREFERSAEEEAEWRAHTYIQLSQPPLASLLSYKRKNSRRVVGKKNWTMKKEWEGKWNNGNQQKDTEKQITQFRVKCVSVPCKVTKKKLCEVLWRTYEAVQSEAGQKKKKKKGGGGCWVCGSCCLGFTFIYTVSRLLLTRRHSTSYRHRG